MREKIWDVLFELMAFLIIAVLILIPAVAMIALIKFALSLMGVVG